MSKKLCIEWVVNGGRGFTSPKDDTPEERKALEQHAGELRREWQSGEFNVVEYPYARTAYMPGPLAQIARELAATRELAKR